MQPGKYYRASAYALQNNSRPGDAFVRVSWYATSDGSGAAISTDDSLQTISGNSPTFGLLQTDPIEAPSGAHSASLRLMFRPANENAATVLFDDAAFVETAAPTDAPVKITPTPPAGSTPGPTPPSVSSTRRTPHVTPATATPTPTPVPEPDVFPVLVNGGFETAREDGTPYGWHKIGGEIAVTDEQRVEGDLALELSSDTSSTKWAYEAVGVVPGAYYSASAWAMAAAGDTVLLRVSWYSSNDASGAAIDSADSLSSVVGGAGEFRSLSTGPVQAPAGAHSARVRLLLQPASAAPTRAFFDDVSLQTDAPPVANPAAQATTHAALGSQPSARVAGPTPEVLGAISTPVGVANVRPEGQDQSQPATLSGGGSSVPWLALAFLIPGLALGGLATEEVIRARRRGVSTPDA